MGTEVTKTATEAEQARFRQLKDIIRRSQEDAQEWYKAAREVQETCLWRHWHPTWDDFCQKVLKMTAKGLGEQGRYLGQSKSTAQPKLPAPAKASDTDLYTHCERLAKRFRSFVNGWVKITHTWPEEKLPPELLEELDDLLWAFGDKCEHWFADHAVGANTADKLGPRIGARTKQKRKRKKV